MNVFVTGNEEAKLERLQGLIKLYMREAVKVASPSAETYARATYLALRRAATESGQNPDIEVQLVEPGKEAYDGAGKGRWMVMWEAGPYSWAIDTSMEITMHLGLCEPYYSFDLCFYEGEIYQ